MNFFYRIRFQQVRTAVLLLFLFCSLTTLNAKPADRDVKGKVVDDKGAPLISATVVVKDSRIGTTTDDNGAFSIHVPSGKTIIVVSIVGYQTQEIKLGSQNDISVTMVTEVNQMNDVVVVGYGTAKKATLTGAVSSIKGSEILKSPATNVSNNLVGRLAGLSAVQSSGEPGYDGSTIRIRGINTTGDNGALIVIDGVAGRDLERIDPNTIESVSVLKDASAAIYGARAANGVILITTKRGKLGKPQLSLNVNYGYNQPTMLPKMADAATFAQMNNEIIIYNKLPVPEWLPAFKALAATGSYTSTDPNIGVISASSLPIDGSPDGIKKYKDGSDPWGHPNTDWYTAVLKKQSAQSAINLSLTGGSDAIRYFISLGTQGQDGNYYHSATRYDQYNFRSNLDAKVTKDINLSFDVSGRMENRRFPTRSAGDIFRMTMRGKPTQPAYWPDGTPGPDIEYGNNPAVISTDATGYDKDERYVINSNIKLNINIPWVKGLSITGTAALDKGFDSRKVWQTPWYLYSWNYTDYVTVDGVQKPLLNKGKRGYDAPALTQSYFDSYLSTLDALVNYDNTFGDHSVKFLAGVEEIQGNYFNFSAYRAHYISPALDQIFAGAALDKDNGGSGSVSARLSYFGRVNYAFKSKYLAEFVWRYDGSYIFPEDKRFGFFPGVSAGWVASEEGFWKKNFSGIDYFKLRASYGTTGNDRIAEWQYLASYGLGNLLGFGNYPFVTNGNIENTVLYENIVPNPNITWEVAKQADVGFNMSILKNKLSIEADYFHYNRTGFLLRPTNSIPQSAGYTPPYINGGKVINQGFEFNITYNGSSRDFRYKVGVNTSYAKNKIIDVGEPKDLPAYLKVEGHPIGSSSYYVATGVFVDQAQIDKTPHISGARPGDLIFQDRDGDGQITTADVKNTDKTGFPTLIMGANADLQYKGFDLSVLFQSGVGAVNYISTESGLIGNFLQSFAANRWTPENPNATGPRTYDRNQGLGNTYYLHKTDYVRLKNVQFGYTLPANIVSKINLSTVRVYFAGYNLWTYSPDYKDFDPELSSGSGQSYPLQRVVSFGISVTF